MNKMDRAPITVTRKQDRRRVLGKPRDGVQSPQLGSRTKQLSFLPPQILEHGGDIQKGRRKTARPFDSKRALHIVMRAPKARGKLSMLADHNARKIRALVYKHAKHRGVRIYQVVNVGNHLHIIAKAKHRCEFQAFLRIITGRIACIVTDARKANGFGKFCKTLYLKPIARQN